MTNEIPITYEKRKNAELFSSLEKPDGLFLSKTQNYIPIYNRFFLLNETNYNSVNFNHPLYLNQVKKEDEDNKNLYRCTLKSLKSNKKILEKNVFFKFAPLLDPFKYLIGKYNVDDPSLFTLPAHNSIVGNVHPKILDENNSSYVDGLFSFLSSTLIHKYNFIHGVDYYGSFLSLKNDFKINVFDDIDYLAKSEFFNNNKNKLFQIEEYEYLLDIENVEKKPQLKIDHTTSNRSDLSIKSINDDLYEDLFVDQEHLTLGDLKNLSIDLLDVTNEIICDVKTTTIKSESSCSSRTSHTSSENDNEDDDEEINTDESVNESGERDKSEEDDDEEDEDDEDEDDEDDIIYATIPKFPVQVICMEHCEDTFDDLIMNNELEQDEWFSAFMQIIMILITYQKAFSFTHNDLHSNNVMYNTTNKKYIHYCYNNKYYKVPTFGRIFKIIDFGRSIYKYNGNKFCSDSFQPGGDASTQYNTEPYLNDKKPRLDPNFSFDLCRLACSIFDYLIEDLDEIEKLDECSPLVKLIVEWCLDDNGTNILYKNNGVERYPDFKLYKMIARHVHNHTPQLQLLRPEFSKYEISKNNIQLPIINIDEIVQFN